MPSLAASSFLICLRAPLILEPATLGVNFLTSLSIGSHGVLMKRRVELYSGLTALLKFKGLLILEHINVACLSNSCMSMLQNNGLKTEPCGVPILLSNSLSTKPPK